MSQFVTPEHPICTIVYLDDCLKDLVFLQEAVLRTGIPLRIIPFDSAEKAISWLRGGHNQPIVVPAIFLSDYDLGSTKGHEIVPHIRAAPHCAATSIIIVSDSADDAAIDNSYRTGANHFLQKPATLVRMVNFVRTLYQCAIGSDFGELTQLDEYRVWPIF